MNTEENFSHFQSEAAHRFRDLQSRLGESAKTMSQATDRYIHANPWKTIAIAALVGCVIGFLVRPRRD